MKCPACKKDIPDNTLRCPHCKTRTGLLCKNCHTINSIQDTVCKNCGKELLKICPDCNCVNLPDAKKCRKCGKSFIKEDTISYIPPFISRKNAVTTILQGILSENKHIFSVCGEKGVGKNTVLKNILGKICQHNYTFLFGKCTPLTQLTPGGVIQDMILNLFNLPNYCLNTTNFKKDAVKFFQNEFPEMSYSEISDFINFLYASQNGKFEDLLINKKNTFSILFKIFDKFVKNEKFIIIVDNFDFIDGFSYEFLNHLIKRENVLDNTYIILMYTEPKPVQGYFNINIPYIYSDVCIAPMDDEEISEFCRSFEEKLSYIDDEDKKGIIEKSKGNPAFLEQALNYCFDCQIGDLPFELPETFSSLINLRLKNLKKLNYIAYKLLVGASILGDKINIALLREVFRISEFDDAIEYLQKMDFITQVNEIYYEFKTLMLWETILTQAKTDNDFKELNIEIAQTLNSFMLNSNAVLGIIAQNIKETQLALDIWTKNTRLAAYIGDVNLYVISQKQCLALINELDDSQTLNVRYNISERLGKLLADYNQTEALEFLPDAIANAKSMENTPKEIELLGYLAYCCERTNNFFGNIECVDAVLGKTNPEHKLSIALLKTAKLKSLLNIGNCGEVINLIDNDIMPVLDKYLTKQYKSPFSYEFVYETWLKTYLILANALIIQGNDRSFEILTIIFDIIERNNIQESLFICNCKLSLAFANTMRGDFYTSESILQDILNLYKDKSMDNEIVLRWNLIKIINNVFKGDFEDLQKDLFEVVTFANNCGDNFTKNILKTLLGKVFKNNDQAKHALGIYQEQIAYFAKEKMAIGALLTWYLMADATLDVEGPHAAMEIAEQALDVAQNPKISNYLFIILFKIVIAKSCIVIADYETAKIHIENAIILASKFNLKDILSRLYLLYGKYFQELGLMKTDKQTQYLQSSDKMYEKAIELIKHTRNNSVYIETEKAKTVLKSFCQLNGISL